MAPEQTPTMEVLDAADGVGVLPARFGSLTTVRAEARPVATAPQGERLEADTRLVISPAAGVFQPSGELGNGSPIAAGQVVGHLHTGAERTPVVSPFSGLAGDVLAWAGERLAAHQPVLWLSVLGGAALGGAT